MSIPDKCPKCGAAAESATWPDIRFECGTWLHHSDPNQQGAQCVWNQRDQLAARVKRLEEEVKQANRIGWIQAAGLCGKLALTQDSWDAALNVLQHVVTWEELVAHADPIDVEALAKCQWLVEKLRGTKAKKARP